MTRWLLVFLHGVNFPFVLRRDDSAANKFLDNFPNGVNVEITSRFIDLPTPCFLVKDIDGDVIVADFYGEEGM